MRWLDEIEQFQSLSPDLVPDFAAFEQKQEAISRYNRAIEQIEAGDLDIASIALRQLFVSWPDFIEAGLLSSCCQMHWGDSSTAYEILATILDSPYLSEDEAFQAEHYMRAVESEIVENEQAAQRRRGEHPWLRRKQSQEKTWEQLGASEQTAMENWQRQLYGMGSWRSVDIASPAEQAEIWQLGSGPHLGTPLKKVRSYGRRRLEGILILLVTLAVLAGIISLIVSRL